MSSRHGTTKSLGNKHVLDKFYTRPHIVTQMLTQLDLNAYDVIIEPAAGSGAFSNHIPNCVAYDIQPEHGSIIKADWLTLNKTEYENRKCLIIGNPPFGNNGSLAMRFITESAKIADTIAFILPRGFKKSSYKNRVPTNFHLTYETDLPTNAFTLNGEPYNVPSIIQIWQKNTQYRTINKNTTTSTVISFVEKQEADFRIQRVGGNAGKASTNLNYSPSSNYFIKNISTQYDNQQLINIINNITYQTITHTTGPKSLPKQELITNIERRIEELNSLNKNI